MVDQAVLGAASREPVYVAVVKNDDRRGLRWAWRRDSEWTVGWQRRGRRARQLGTASTEPANVPPGGTAVAFDRLPVVPSGTLREPRFRVAAFRRVPKFPVERVTAAPRPQRLQADRRGHRLAATPRPPADRPRPAGPADRRRRHLPHRFGAGRALPPPASASRRAIVRAERDAMVAACRARPFARPVALKTMSSSRHRVCD